MTHSLYRWSLLWVVLGVLGCSGKPGVEGFSADKASVGYANPVTLSWLVKDAESLSISGVGEVSGTSVVVYPTETTTYTLTATNKAGSSTSQPVSVQVTSKLDIQGAAYSSGSMNGTSVIVRLRTAQGGVQSTDSVVEVKKPDGSAVGNFTCPANQSVCLTTFPLSAAEGGTYNAVSSINGESVTGSFSIGTERLAQPVVTATIESSSTASASWTSAPNAVIYSAKIINLDNQHTVSNVALTTNSSVSLTYNGPGLLDPNGNFAVSVEAYSIHPTNPQVAETQVLPKPLASRALGYASSSSSRWRAYGSADFSGNTLTVNFGSLDVSESLAVVVLNYNGRVDAQASLSITGTGAPPSGLYEASGSSAVAALTAFDPIDAMEDSAREAHQSILEKNRQVLVDARDRGLLANIAPEAPTALPATTSFCVNQGINGNKVRKAATLVHESAHAGFYVDDQDLSQYNRTGWSWTELAACWEGTAGIYETDRTTFGAESDIDSNGKLIIFFSRELGVHSNGGLLLGYYYAADIVYPRDTSQNCTQMNAFNRADIFYLNSLGNVLAANGNNVAQALNVTYPDTLAHEFQHLINFNQKYLVHGQQEFEDAWINEGMSMMAEDLTGFGWNNDAGRRNGRMYMQRLAGPNVYGYNRSSLTDWTPDPIGAYQGTHSFFRFYTDKLNNSMLSNIVQTGQVGVGNIERVLSLPLDRAMLDWATALLFSNETTAGLHSRFSFAPGTAWTPLHQRLQYLDYVPFGPGAPVAASMKRNGWNAFVSGTGLNAPVTLTLSSSETVKPQVAVIRFSGTLPRPPP